MMDLTEVACFAVMYAEDNDLNIKDTYVNYVCSYELMRKAKQLYHFDSNMFHHIRTGNSFLCSNGRRTRSIPTILKQLRGRKKQLGVTND